MKANIRLLLIYLPFLIIQINIQSQTINVPTDYPTIQAAINAANPGDVIEVAEGTYNLSTIGGSNWEPLSINKSLTLKGAGSNFTILNAEYPLGHCDVIAIRASNVNIEGIYITGGTYGMRIPGYSYGDNISHIYLKDVVIEESSSSGLVFDGAGTLSTVTIEDSEFNNNDGRGIYIAPGKDVSNLTLNNVKANLNTNSGFHNQGNLINLLISGGEYNSNKGIVSPAAYGAGIWIERTNGAIINNVELHNNGFVYPSRGFYASNVCSNVEIRNSNISGSRYGILFLSTSENANNKATGNNITNCEEGLADYHGKNNTHTNNTISDCSVAGMITGGTLGILTITDNELFNNAIQFNNVSTAGTQLDLDFILTNNLYDHAIVVRDIQITVPIIFSKIQEAIDEASTGQIVDVSVGTYNETITINKLIQLNGAGINTTIITGSVLINALNNTGRVILRNISVSTNNSPYMVETRYAIFINGAEGNTAPITFENVEALMSNPILPTVYGTGLLISPEGNVIDDVVISNCIFNNSYTHGIYIKNNLSAIGGTVSNILIENCILNDNDTKGGTSFYGYGLYILAPNINPTLIVDGLNIINSTFNGHYRIGLYIESLKNAIFSGVSATGNGEEGINLNLKYGNYSNLSFENCTFINNSANGIAKPDIHIKGRDDAPYNSNPAEVQNISISSCTFDGASFGNNITDIPVLYGNYIRNGIVNYRNSGSINCSGNWWGTIDPVIISSTVSGLVDYSPWWGNNYINDSHESGWNWITNGDLQKAINSSQNGDTVSVNNGEYIESFSINRTIVFQSLNPEQKAIIKGAGTLTNIAASGVILKNIIYDLTGNTTADGVIVIDRGGTWPNYTIQHSNITFSGVEVLGGRRALFATVGNIIIENCRFEDQFRDALFFNAVSGITTIRNNYFKGANANKAILFENFSSGDPTVSGTIIIEGNTVEGKRNFIVYNQWLNPEIPISIKIEDNSIAPYGTAVSVYDPREFLPAFNPINFSKISTFELRKNRFALSSGQVGVESPIEIKNKIDARRNWWGDFDGPDVGALVNGINPIPWCYDSDCTKFTAISVAPGDSIKKALDLAEDGDTISIDMSTITEVFTIENNVTLKFTEPPVIDSFKVKNANLTLATNITITGGLDLSNGNIVINENAKVIFDTSAAPPIETPTAKIIGIVEVKPREVGSGAIQLLGLEIDPGIDDLGKISLIRKSGNEGVVSVSGNSGVSMTWEISTDNQPESGRIVKFNWLADFDNGVNPSSVVVYRNTGSGWEYYAGPFDATGNPRQVIVNVAGFSSWTLGGSDAPLPVQLTSFTSEVTGNNVTLNWQTATEVNNYGFEIERLALSAEPQEWEEIGFVQGNGNSNSPKSYSYVDELFESGTFSYRLKQIDLDGQYEYYETIVEVNFNITDVEETEIPNEFNLSQNYPNPFNPVTTIKYSIPNVISTDLPAGKAGGRNLNDFSSTSSSRNDNILVTLKVYDILGREVVTLVNEQKSPGIYNVEFDGSRLTSGVYLYKLQYGEFTSIKKFILMK